MSLEHLIPESKEMIKKKKRGRKKVDCIKRNRSQLEMALTGQNWDNLSTNHEEGEGISLVVRWLTVCLPMQGMWVRSLVKGTRCHMLQQKSPCATTKTRCSQKKEKHHPKGDQPWVFFGRTDAKAETPVLWPPPAKS